MWSRKSDVIGSCDLCSRAAIYSYGYDGANRLSSFTDSRGSKQLTYSYSPAGLLNSMTDAEGRNTDYLYNASGRMIGQWLPNNAYVSWEYDDNGRLVERGASTGVKANYTWFEDGNLKSVQNLVDNNQLVGLTSYTLDAYGERATVDENLGSTEILWRYSYDANAQVRDIYYTPKLPTAGTEALHRSLTKAISTTRYTGALAKPPTALPSIIFTTAPIKMPKSMPAIQAGTAPQPTPVICSYKAAPSTGRWRGCR